MTGNTANHHTPEIQVLFDAWKGSTQNVLSQVAGQPNTFELVFEQFAAADSDLRYLLAATGAVQGEMALRLPQASAIRLARKFLGEPEADAAEVAPAANDEQREALEELLRQIAGLAATAIGSNIGGQVQLTLSRADAPWTSTSAAVTLLRTRDEAGADITLEIRISPALATAIASRAAATQTPSAAASESNSPSSPAQHADTDADSDPRTAGYRRLLDVGLGVKLRFGTRRMLLRDLLALSSGLVVELDNKLNSPVDLLLDGRVIARGEVVVIDGKYGLRVTDVVDSPLSAGAQL